jgi:plasmid stabilization system protein ParE
MPELFVSPEAEKDLRDIQAYISDKLERPRAAFNVVSAFLPPHQHREA